MDYLKRGIDGHSSHPVVAACHPRAVRYPWPPYRREPFLEAVPAIWVPGGEHVERKLQPASAIVIGFLFERENAQKHVEVSNSGFEQISFLRNIGIPAGTLW